MWLTGAAVEGYDRVMILHSDILTQDDLRDAMLQSRTRPIRHSRVGSRSRDHAFDVSLSGSSAYRSQADRDEHAATWDEWGIFFAVLFDRDPNMIAGDKSFGYSSAFDFHWQTDDRFHTLTHAGQHRQHKWQPADPYVNTCMCGAKRRWLP